MTIRALAIPETVPHDPGTTSKTLFVMTGHARERLVLTLERVARKLRVTEHLYFERFGDVTDVAVAFG
jgi:hypothetical protein